MIRTHKITLRLCAGFVFAASCCVAQVEQASVDEAIRKVYPALVQIHVVTVYTDAGRERKAESAGSGVIISPEGYVVTNHHVAGKATALHCVLSSREELDAALVGSDALTDIAVIKLDLSTRSEGAEKLTTAIFGTSQSVRIGDPVLAMGSPLAISQSVTKGIVANKEMMLPKFFGPGFRLDGESVGLLVKWIGHDAQILPGNSGGPLVNLQGEIVGINEINLGGAYGGGLGGAIPGELAGQVAEELIKNGRVRRAYTGLELQPLLKTQVKETAAKGALVSGVIPGSPADRSGIRAGDILLSLNETPVHIRFREELPALHLTLFSQPVGSTLKLKLLRGREEIVVQVTTELREDVSGKEREVKEWGIIAENLTTMSAKELQRHDKTGVLISSVKSGGPADQASPPLAPNDVILEAAGKKLENMETLLQTTASITANKAALVPTLVTFERKSERLMSIVEIGIRTPQVPIQEVRKAWLPVASQVLSKKLATALGLSGKKGVRVTYVYPESSAESAGIHIGDILTHVENQLIEASEPQDVDVLETMLRAYPIGSKPVFTVIREGKPLEITATLAEQPKPVRELKVYENIDLEFRARDISYMDRIEYNLKKDEGGALVVEVQPGGWAAVGGLFQGDIIRQINGKKIGSIKDLEEPLSHVRTRKVEFINILVKRGIRTLFVEIEPAWPQTE